jgi:lysophospholipase L1-like esterase
MAGSVALVLLAGASGSVAQGTPDPPALPKECGEQATVETALPNSARALQQRRKLKILAIGASSATVLGGGLREGSQALLEQVLERAVKGLDVEIVNRGVSGELAAAAASRLKNEVALNEPDVVLWQVGTNDVLAQVPAEEFEETVTDMVRWLKEHNVDVILVGLHYLKQLAQDPQYQAVRASLRRIATLEGVLHIGRYEVMQVLSRTQRESGRVDFGELALSEAGYNCVARYVARAIAVGLYAKPPKIAPAP